MQAHISSRHMCENTHWYAYARHAEMSAGDMCLCGALHVASYVALYVSVEGLVRIDMHMRDTQKFNGICTRTCICHRTREGWRGLAHLRHMHVQYALICIHAEPKPQSLNPYACISGRCMRNTHWYAYMIYTRKCKCLYTCISGKTHAYMIYTHKCKCIYTCISGKTHARYTLVCIHAEPKPQSLNPRA